MAQEKPSKLAEWVVAIRAHAPELRRAAGEWCEQVRDEPVLLWETPAIRYGVYGLCAMLLVACISFGIRMITPPAPAGAGPEATTADFHVLCAHPECGAHFVIHRKFGFSRFPVECPHCGRTSGQRAVPCTAEDCTQRWVLPTGEP